jgi:acetylornithine deacetylase/succinyl-diaminopimelate desuccinylase-like protein
VGVALDSNQVHAPNERIDLSLLLRGAEASAYLWEELASAGPDLT